jgi:hypothetical protein
LTDQARWPVDAFHARSSPPKLPGPGWKMLLLPMKGAPWMYFAFSGSKSLQKLIVGT